MNDRPRPFPSIKRVKTGGQFLGWKAEVMRKLEKLSIMEKLFMEGFQGKK